MRRGVVAAALSTILTVPLVVALPPVASGAVTPEANPEIADSCGLDLTLVLDASGSVKDAGAVNEVRDASNAFLQALAGTNSQARITQFASLSEQLLQPTEITAASVAPGGQHADALNRYYNPQPPRPGNVDLWQYDGRGDALIGSNYRLYNNSSSSRIWTNWDASLAQAGTAPAGFGLPELVVYITDGRPTAFDFSESGDPKDQGPPPDVAISNSGNPSGSFETQALDRAVLEANDLKSSGTRMLAVGVGTALQNSADRNRLVAISGPQVVDDDDLSNPNLDINKIDVALVSDFDDLADALRKIVLQLCSPSLTITKLAQTADSSAYEPAQGWDFTVTPFSPLLNGKDFDWILPAGGTGTTNPSKSAMTGANGTAQFQWEPTNPPEADSRAVVTEALEPGYTAGRPGTGNDYLCELRDEDGNVRIEQGDLNASTLSFELNPIGQEIVACTVWNSFDYDSEIAITKVNSPTQIRGDLTPPASVTSTYEVTNAGNSALTGVNVTDDKCSPVNYQSGDTGNDQVLPAGFLPNGNPNPAAETWVYTCVRDFSRPVSKTPENVQNTATVTATDPRGVPVEPKTDDDDVDIYTAGIDIVKEASPTEVPVGYSGDIDYSYTVTNLGSLDLDLDKATGVTDNETTDPNYNATCAPVTYDSGDVNNDDLLQPNESWTFECTSAVTDVQGPLANLATVAADPQFPNGTAAPPAVTDNDPAVVTVFDADLALTKTVGTDAGVCSGDKSIQVTPGTTVYYCYEISNPGGTDLRSPTQAPGPDTQNGWVVDDLGPTGTCSPVTYASGDLNNDGLLAPNGGETWRYFCSKPISQDAINTAVVVAETNTATPQRLTRFSQAEVEVLTPEIAVEKIELRPVVVDPAALEQNGGTLIAGPDSPPGPRPAAYSFFVSNPGQVPLADVDLTDTWDQGSCDPSFVSGDDGNDLLDPGEVWEYQCVLAGGSSEGARLTKADGDQAWQDGGGVGPAPVTDTACVTATSELDGQPLTEVCSNSRTLLVIQPEIELRKTASPTLVRVGASVTYTFEVENVGDVGLRPLGVLDDKCSPVEYQSGDDGNGILDGPLGANGAETWTYTCSRSINVLGEDVNTAQVLATDPLGNTHGFVSEATVRTFDPAISLVKEVSDNLVPSGSQVTYTFTVTNTGKSPVQADDLLTPVELADASDPENPGCTTPQFVGGDTNDNQALERTESWIYTCTGVITEQTIDLALVGGIAIDGGLVADADLQIVTPFTPAIEIVKTPDKTLLDSPGPVTYTYEVTNSGNVPLADVADTITDDKCSPVEYVSGDVDGDGLLDTQDSIFEDAFDETWVFTCTTNISETTLNTAVVTGNAVDPEGNGLCDEEQPSNGAAPAAEPVGCEVDATDTALVEVLDVGTVVIEPPTKSQPLPPTGARFLEALLLGLLLMVLGTRLRTLRFGFARR